MGGATRGGTAEPTSRDQNKRQERGQGKETERRSYNRRQFLARKRRRRGRAERRLLRQRERRNRARARGREITVAVHNVRMMAVDGKHGVGRALDVLSVYDRLGCDVRTRLECTPSPPSFLFRTTTLCPHPSSSSAILLEAAG